MHHFHIFIFNSLLLSSSSFHVILFIFTHYLKIFSQFLSIVLLSFSRSVSFSSIHLIWFCLNIASFLSLCPFFPHLNFFFLYNLFSLISSVLSLCLFFLYIIFYMLLLSTLPLFVYFFSFCFSISPEPLTQRCLGNSRLVFASLVARWLPFDWAEIPA